MKHLFLALTLLCLVTVYAARADTQADIRINEIAASASPYKAERGYDWVELYNAGTRAVSLAGWTLTAGENGKNSYVFPNSAKIGAGKYLVVFCTDEEVASSRIYAYVSGYKLPAKNAGVSLWDEGGALRDKVDPALQYGNITYGCAGDGGDFAYLPYATRGLANPADGYKGRARQPLCDKTGGFYSAPVTVTLTAQEGTRIVYTLDGSTPTDKSAEYSGALIIDRTTVLRAAALSDALLPSQPVSATFFIMPAPHTPVVSLMADAVFLTDESTGLLVRGSGSKANYSQDWEYPLQIEYFNANGYLEISQMCGFQISGGLSRARKQKSLVFYARAAYGNDVFLFNPFPNRAYASVKSFMLRTGGTESPATTTLLRDAMLTGMAIGTGTTGSDGVPVMVYLNGQPYGVYILRERLNKYGIAAIEGITDNNAIDGIDLLYMTGYAKNGSNADYTSLSAFMRGNDLNIRQNLDKVLDQMDVDSYFDYAALMMITGDEDVHNALFYRVPGGKWKWVFYDADSGFRYTGNQPITRFLRDKKDSREDGLDHVPFSALMEVPAMKEKFLARMGELLNGLFRETDFTARAYRWRGLMLPMIPFQAEKWGNPASVDMFVSNMEDFLSLYRRRMPNLLMNIQACFKLNDEQMAAYFGAFKAEQGIK
jgi:hypothetical protein